MNEQEFKDFSCSFCKRAKSEVQKLIAGKNSMGMVSFICDLCTEVCYRALKNATVDKKINSKSLNPKQIYEELCKYVEGQEEAKKTLSVAAYNHYKRTSASENTISKSNILLIGPSGCGKTLLIEILSKILDVPFVSVDVTTMTETGYVGEDPDVAIQRLFQAAKYDIKKTERGIVFFDEIDKIRKKNNSVDGSMDVSGVGVQHSLLKLIEGTVVNISPNNKRSYGQETVAIDTTNILFICAGAFEDLVKIVSKDVKTNIGFNNLANEQNKYDELVTHLKSDHLIKYGIIPELLGRLQVNVVLKELTIKDLSNMLTKPHNALLKQYQELLRIKDGAELIWTDEAVDSISKEAILSKTGARGLKAILDKILTPIMFDLPSMRNKMKVILDTDLNGLVTTNLKPLKKIAKI